MYFFRRNYKEIIQINNFCFQNILVLSIHHSINLNRFLLIYTHTHVNKPEGVAGKHFKK